MNQPTPLVSIRSECAEDRAAVFAIHAGAFPSNAEARLVDLLRAAGRLQVSLVAVIDGQVVGHAAFSPVTIDDQPGFAGVGLGPVAVAAANRQRGIAAEIIRRGLRDCALVGAQFAVVLGDAKYYRRFGFRPAAEFGLRSEYDAGEAFQAVELVSGALGRAGRGDALRLVRYAPEFGSVGA